MSAAPANEEVLGRACLMDYQYSIPLPADRYAQDKDYSSMFLPRIHKDASIANDASVELQLDWYGEGNIGREIGNLNSHAGNFAALCAPECSPKRLGLVAYVFEYGFIHDDHADAQDQESLLRENQALLQALDPQGNIDAIALSGLDRRKKELRAKIATELISEDPRFGHWFLKYWKKFTESMEDIRSRHFKKLDEYLAFRVSDCGCIWTLSLIRWGMDIYLTPEEERTAGPMSYLGYASLVLTNDLFSWEKEKKASVESNGSVPLVNAVDIIMKTESITEEKAKLLIKAKIAEHEERYCKIRDQYIASPKPSQAIIRWFSCLEFSIAGNAVWSLKTARYWKTGENPYEEHRAKMSLHSIRIDSTETPVFDGAGPEIEPRSRIPKRGAPWSSKQDIDLESSLQSLPEWIIIEPYSYIVSLPSKNLRQAAIDALHTWYNVPEKPLMIIQGVINLLHNASLMFNDIQDGSSLRRGHPAAHRLFGVSQTINSASYSMNKALCLVQKLSPKAVSIYSDELHKLHLGQGYDLHWTFHRHIPTEKEYLSMIDGKTGGMFRLVSRLMRVEATQNRDLDIEGFMTQFGRHFQIRDDYQNLRSADYRTQKGFCEDLDEGKFSLPLVYALRKSPNDTVLRSIMQMREEGTGLSIDLKQCALERISSTGGLEYTRSLLNRLQAELLHQMDDLEERTGVKNWILHLLIKKMEIQNENEEGEAKIDSDQDSFWYENQGRAWVDV